MRYKPFFISPILLLYFAATFPGASQSVKGRITNDNNEPVPFVVIYDETTFTGVTGNAEGNYELRLEPGNHVIVYKAMGFHQVRKSVEIGNSTLQMDVIMKEQPVAVKEVVITPGEEDPAYAIMRKVIGLAPLHLNQVDAYEADVYLRGTLNILKMPRIISKHAVVSANGKEYHLKTGDVFMEESVNRIHFRAPDKYEQKVLSFRSTFPWNNEDVNPIGLISSSLYAPEVDEFISPLSPRAFNYYSYRYEGFFDEGNRVVFKIKVIPKRNSQQLMRGYLFIVDKLWCLHSADMSMEMFFGDMNMKIIYASVQQGAWLPVSHQIVVDAALMGVNATYKYTSSEKFISVTLNKKNTVVPARVNEPEGKHEPAAPVKAEEKKTKQQVEIEKLMEKEALSNRDMVKLATLMNKEARADTADQKSLEIKDNNRKVTVEKDALRNDTSFWNTIRPIPLSTIENKISAVSDSMLNIKDGKKPEADSASKKGMPPRMKKVTNAIFSGTGFWMFDSTLRVQYKGLLSLNNFDFNTVDGFVFRQSLSLEQRIDSAHRLKITPGIAYAFSREQLMWWTDINYSYAPMRRGNLKFHISGGSADYNSETGIHHTVNSIASLFFRRNYMKLYEQQLAFVSNQIDLANGLNLTASIGYRSASPLVNQSDYSFFFRNERDYSSNLASESPGWLSRNTYNQEAFWDVRFEFTPRYYYRISKGEKRYQHSKYPTLYVRNKMAVPGVAKSTADYDFFEMGVKQTREWGMMHAFSWHIKAGKFLNTNNIFAMDYKYFNNQDLPVLVTDHADAFRLLPYYRNNTSGEFAEAHITFTTPYLLVKYLPFLSNKLWCENLHLNYLTGNNIPHYLEVGYSVSQIYLMGSVGVFAGFSDLKYKSVGVRVSLNLD
ncbi:MAG: carboxypeptidase-like regulatory domain-containing protein [Bacteroidales bacterium]|nr:carboxypeptidase-like regulatory domain-containing protein [Bacteroidales bacterium]